MDSAIELTKNNLACVTSISLDPSAILWITDDNLSNIGPVPVSFKSFPPSSIPTWIALSALIDMPLSASEATDEQSSAVNGHDASIRPLCLELAARVNAFL